MSSATELQETYHIYAFNSPEYTAICIAQNSSSVNRGEKCFCIHCSGASFKLWSMHVYIWIQWDRETDNRDQWEGKKKLDPMRQKYIHQDLLLHKWAWDYSSKTRFPVTLGFKILLPLKYQETVTSRQLIEHSPGSVQKGHICGACAFLNWQSDPDTHRVPQGWCEDGRSLSCSETAEWLPRRSGADSHTSSGWDRLVKLGSKDTMAVILTP